MQLISSNVETRSGIYDLFIKFNCYMVQVPVGEMHPQKRWGLNVGLSPLTKCSRDLTRPRTRGDMARPR